MNTERMTIQVPLAKRRVLLRHALVNAADEKVRGSPEGKLAIAILDQAVFDLIDEKTNWRGALAYLQSDTPLAYMFLGIEQEHVFKLIDIFKEKRRG